MRRALDWFQVAVAVVVIFGIAYRFAARTLHIGSRYAS